ncbi:MAG TPA: L,D-transpeptidase family protein [Pirellulaceae bacterium]
MNTIKSAALLVVLVGVLYGVYVALSKPDVVDHAHPAGGDSGPPLIEWNSPGAMPSAPSSASYTAPASDDRWSQQPNSQHGGSSAPSLEPNPMPPPSSVAAPGFASNTNSSGLAQSAYEAPAASTSATPSASQATATDMTPASPASAAAPSIAAYDLRRDMAEVEQLIGANRFKSALAKLTPHYFNPDLSADQRSVLISWLDPLAAKVIYSREHLLASAHTVRKGETLFDIAHQYNVEYRLLQNINSREVSDPLILVPATELKVVPGPFHADVNLTSGELTLVVGDLYAGRFPFTVGDQPPQPGEYKIIDKRSQQKTYLGFDGRMIPANDPNNPYGGWWISLGGEVAIHGSPAIPGDKTLGCISLSPQDAQDVYGILSISSEVKIRR